MEKLLREMPHHVLLGPLPHTIAHSTHRAGHLEDGLFRRIFDNAAVPMAIGDTEGVLVYANQSLADMIGVPVERLCGISVYQFAHPDDKEEINNVVFATLAQAREGTVNLERRLVRADGNIRWVGFAITYVKGFGEQPDYLLAIGEDVTERHQLQAELHRQAYHDALTGLPNRRHLLERIQTLAAEGGTDRLGLCFVDLDRFKEVNDDYGHSIGDHVLCTVASRMRDSVASYDCLVTRLGGDEFVVLVLPPADHSTVNAVSDHLLSALATPIAIGSHLLRISASIGAIITTLSTTPATALLDAADRELYDAKNRGKEQCVLRLLDTRIEK